MNIQSGTKKRALIELHIAVLLFGFTAILGKAITLNTFMLVWWRMILAIVFFVGLFFWWKKDVVAIFKNIPLKLLGIGCIIGVHWYCFYGSVKISHVSVGVMCMALTSLFTTLMEPYIMKKNFDWWDFFISILYLPLMYWMIDGIKDFNLLGFVVGVLAAFFAALFSLLNKRLVDEQYDTTMLSFYEFIGVFLFCTPLAIYYIFKDGLAMHTPTQFLDLLCIAALAFLCTNLAFLMCVNSFKKIDIFYANLIVGLEPVYGILLSILFFQEQKYFDWNFYAAASLIFALIYIHPIIKARFVSKT